MAVAMSAAVWTAVGLALLAGNALLDVQGQVAPGAVVPPPHNASIAIIGGGVHGLLLATELSKAGYSNLTIFEASHKVVPVACSVQLGGTAYGCSLVLWPADNYEDAPGPPANLMELLQQANITVGPPPELSAYINTNTAQQELIPPFLKPGLGSPANRTDMQMQLLKIWQLLYELWNYPHTPLGVIQSGLVFSNETLGEWVARQGLPAFLAVHDFEFRATITSADVASVPAAVMLNAARAYGSVFKAALFALGQDPEDPAVPAPLRAALQACYAPNGICYDWVTLTQDQRTFFENLAEALPESTKLRTATAVVSVRPNPNGTVTVAYDAAGQPGQQIFDRAVLAVRAADARQLLPPDALAMPLYDAVTLGAQPQLRSLLAHTFVYQLAKTTTQQGAAGGSAAAGGADLVGARLLSGGGNASFVGYMLPLDLPHLVNGTPASILYPHPGGQGMSAYSLADTILLPEVSDAEAAARRMLLRMGFPVTGVIEARRFQYPDFVSSEVQREVDVYAEYEDLQGQQGLYYTGEALSGPTVILGLDFVQDLVQRHFT